LLFVSPGQFNSTLSDSYVKRPSARPSWEAQIELRNPTKLSSSRKALFTAPMRPPDPDPTLSFLLSVFSRSSSYLFSQPPNAPAPAPCRSPTTRRPLPASSMAGGAAEAQPPLCGCPPGGGCSARGARPPGGCARRVVAARGSWRQRLLSARGGSSHRRLLLFLPAAAPKAEQDGPRDPIAFSILY
jgi:hypothetical protein